MKTTAPVNCFLIEDDTDDIFLFSHALKSLNQNNHIETADNGLSAIKKLIHNNERPVDCIFIDIDNPVMPGKNFLSAIREIESIRNIPVIIYTISSRKRDIVDTMKMGAFDYIRKPDNLPQLKHRLADVITRMRN